MAWKRWGPYLAERAWGTVREDYSPYGTAWEFFPHDHARSRTYRWNEDGLAGWCDDRQTLCLSLAFWNGRDPILKERIFGLTGNEGNHSEDAKEYWWFVDSTPTHSYMRWRYHYPQREFPYADLVAENRRRTKLDPEYELLDTGAFDDDRYWWIEAEFAKATPDDVYVKVTVGNAGPEPATIDVLPTLWFRNTWAWGIDPRKPTLSTQAGFVFAEHHELGRYVLELEGDPELLFCDNETNTTRLWGVPGPAYPKDGINDHVVHGAATVNPDRVGTKMAARYRLTVAPGETAQVRFTLGPGTSREEETADEILDERRAEADAFYERLTPDGATEDEARVLRQAFAGMLWSKQFFHYDVDRWLDGDPSMPAPPPERLNGRNKDWRHLDSLDVLSMPDTWEYPWFAVVGPRIPLRRARAGRRRLREATALAAVAASGTCTRTASCPAYEWAFGDVNPPVHAWAAFQVFRIDGATRLRVPRARPPQAAHQLHVVGEPQGRSRQQRLRGRLPRARQHRPDRPRRRRCPPGQYLEQSDGTAWMARYCLDLLEIVARRSPMHDRAYEDVATKFFEHFTLHRHGDERPGPLGRGRRLLLRRDPRRRTAHRCRSRAARWSG